MSPKDRKLRVGQGDPKVRPTCRARTECMPEVLLDLPLQAQSLERLSSKQYGLYKRAYSLLSSGNSVRVLISKNIPLSGSGVYEALLARSWALRFTSPEAMVRLAEIAVEVAQGFKTNVRLNSFDLQARAWGELGNAYRAADRLRSAQQAFGQAYTLAHRGSGNLYLKARLLELEASLLGAWREFPLALQRLSSLAGLYQELDESHLAGRALITRALYAFYSGEAREAISLNNQGIDLIDRSGDPALLMLALHNHLLFLIELGEFSQAKRSLFDNSRSFIYKDRINALRLRGLEGRISYGMKQFLSAEIAFREVRDGLVAAGMTFYAALVSLELAMTLRSQGRVEEAEAEVIVARNIFLSLEVYREYLGSVIYLEESFRRREATAELIQATIKHIERKWQQVGPSQMR